MRWAIAEAYDSEPRIDETAGIIYDVLIVGRKAKNGRKYTEEAMESAVKRGLYEHLQVYIGPHKKSRFAKRSPREHAGELSNTRHVDGEIRGDLKYNRESEGGKLCLEIAKRFPKAFGLSHHGFVEGYVKDGIKIVDHILEVKMADIVKDPGTVDGVFEEVETPAEPKEPKSIADGIVDLQTCILADHNLEDATKEKAVKWLHKLKKLLTNTAEEDEDEEAEEAVTLKTLKKLIAEAVAPPPAPPAPPEKRKPMSTARAEVTESVVVPEKPKTRKAILKAYNVEG